MPWWNGFGFAAFSPSKSALLPIAILNSRRPSNGCLSKLGEGLPIFEALPSDLRTSLIASALLPPIVTVVAWLTI